MDGTTVALIILLFGFLVVFWISKFRLKIETGDSYQLAIIALMIILIFYISLLLFSGYQLSEEETNAFTLTSLVLSLGALMITLLLEISNKRNFSKLNSNLGNLKEDICEMNQNMQQIITQINHCEELQKALADQIQSLKSSISAPEPPEKQYKDENGVKIPTDKETKTL